MQQCGIFFSHRSYFVSHKEIHNLQCLTSAMIMGKVFSSNSSLKIHQRIHTGSKPLRVLNVGNPLGQNRTFFSTIEFTLEQNLTSAMPAGEL